MKIEKVVVIDKLATQLSELNSNDDCSQLNVNGNNRNDNRNGYAFGIVFLSGYYITMKSRKNLYKEVFSLGNLTLAWRKARKGKTKRDYVIYFEENFQPYL